MATSAFKSTTKRTPVGTPSSVEDSSSSNRNHRRSRSLSRFSRRLEEPAVDSSEVSAPKGRFVNTVRGSDFPEISLDDLATEFFPFKGPKSDRESERGRSSRRSSEISPSTAGTMSSQRRGRSTSRQSSGVGDGRSDFCNASGGGRAVVDANSRRRRSVSVVRSRISDSETQSSAQTDDEARDSRSGKNMIEKTIRAVYAQKKAEHPTGDDVNGGLYEAMRKELRYAVDEIKMELEQAMVGKTSALVSGNCLQSDNSDVLQTVSVIRENYATKLEQSEKRKQDLLAEIVLEEQHGRELSKIVRELLPDPKSSVVAAKPSRARKRSNDRNRMTKRLTEEAEKYFEDFISNVEDTDLSSFEGEKSDTSSTLGGTTKRRDAAVRYVETETFQSPATSNSLPVEMDGLILPWLQWEPSNDGSPLPCKNKRQSPVTPKTILWDAAQDAISTHDPSSHSTSSRGSWSPGLVDGRSMTNTEDKGTIFEDCGSCQRSQFDMDRYLELKHDEDLLLERWREQNRINSGGLLLCSNVSAFSSSFF